MIDLVALRSLKAIDVHGSVVGAAEALGYSPSAISQQIKRLDKHFGLASLEKFGRGIMLTEHGRRLAEQGSSLLAQVELLEAGVQAEGGKPSGAVRISAHSTACRGLLAPMLAELEAADSAVAVTFVENDPWVSVDLVATGQVDLAVVTTGTPSRCASLRTSRLWTCAWMWPMSWCTAVTGWRAGARSRHGTLWTSVGRSEERRVGKECRSRWSPY